MDIENPHALRQYLQEKEYVPQGQLVDIRNLHGGVSNKTVWVEFSDGRNWVLKQALEKLRVEVDWFSGKERILRESKGMQWLQALCPTGSIPSFIFEDPKHYVLAMEAVPHPHENLKQLLLSGRIEVGYCGQMGQLLGRIHAAGENKASILREEFADRSFFESLRLEPYYTFTASQLPHAQGFFEKLIEETRGDVYTLVHGDYSPKNMLVFKGRLVLLDHEVIHFGDGMFDVGFALCHLLSKAHHLVPNRNKMLQGATEFWKAYTDVVDTLSTQREHRAVQHTLACLLARVHGRSPLEYLSREEGRVQTRITLEILSNPPSRLGQLIEDFGNKLLEG